MRTGLVRKRRCKKISTQGSQRSQRVPSTQRHGETERRTELYADLHSTAGGGAGLRPVHGARGTHENKHQRIMWCLFSCVPLVPSARSRAAPLASEWLVANCLCSSLLPCFSVLRRASVSLFSLFRE